MRRGRAWSISTHKLTLLFAGVLLIPALTLLGLGITLLRQDSELSAQRALEQRQAAVDRVARSLEKSLADVEDLLSTGPLPEGAVRIIASAQGIRTEPSGRVLWSPSPAGTVEVDPRPFAEVEALEFRGSGMKAYLQYK